jgi:hypothetical protein
MRSRSQDSHCSLHLFRSIILYTYPSTQRLARILHTSPHLAAYVKEVSINQKACRKPLLWRPIIHLVANVDALAVIWGTLERPGFEVLEEVPQAMQNLHSLSLKEVVFSGVAQFQQLVCSWTPLRHLTLDDCFFPHATLALGPPHTATYVEQSPLDNTLNLHLESFTFSRSHGNVYFPGPIMTWLAGTTTSRTLRSVNMTENQYTKSPLAEGEWWLKMFPFSLRDLRLDLYYSWEGSLPNRKFVFLTFG